MNPEGIFGFFQTGNSNNVGKIGFTDERGNLIKSIILKKNSNGQWLTTNVNRVLLPGRSNSFSIQQVTTRATQRQVLNHHQEKQSSDKTDSNKEVKR